MFAYVSLQTSQVQKTTTSINREVLPCTKPSVRACTHTPLWSINILIYCTHITKIEGLLTHFSVLSYVCVYICLLKDDTYTHNRGGAFKSSTLYNTQNYLLPWKQTCFTLLNIYLYIYQLIRIIYIYIALYIHSCFVKFPFVL